MKLRSFLNSIMFAWWDGIFSIASIVLFGATRCADFALGQMTDINQSERHVELVPEAVACLRDVEESRDGARAVLRKTLEQLNELDGVEARVKHVGRKQ